MPSGALNNVSTNLTISGFDTTKFVAITTGYIVTIYDDVTYTDPADDPNVEQAFVSAASISGSGSLTLVRSNPMAHTGTPRIALFALARHISDLDTAVNNAETSLALKANSASLAAVATSGAYSDLTGKPSLATVATSGAYTDLTGRPSLATVATTGAYADLTGKPTIPSTKADVGLGNVDNTSDANKPVSTAQAAADTTVLKSSKSFAIAMATAIG